MRLIKLAMIGVFSWTTTVSISLQAAAGSGVRNANTGLSEDTGIEVLPVMIPEPNVNRTTPRNPRNSGRAQMDERSPMTGVETSGVPGMSCPLIDNRPHGELLAAVENLYRHINPVDQCQNNSEVEKMSRLAEQLRASGTSLNSMWNNPEALVADPTRLSEFQRQMESMVSGMNLIGETLTNNSLMNSKCGRQLMSGTGILQALGDLATSLAPFALLGASINPSWSVGIKLILGVTGAGSLSKILSEMNEKGTLDMRKPENRLAVLQNTCEFSKIAQRVRFLKLAQSGQIDQVTNELKMMKNRTQRVMLSSASDKVMTLVQAREDIQGKLESARRQNRKDSSELNAMMRQLQQAQDDMLYCTEARFLAANYDQEDQFPRTAVENFRMLIKNQGNQMTQVQARLLAKELQFRERLMSIPEASLESRLNDCARSGKIYVEQLKQLVIATDETIKKHELSLNAQLMKDSDYASYQAKERAAVREIETLTKVGSILERLNQDNSVIDKSEMHTQMYLLKASLFNSESFMRKSPVFAWLQFSNEQFVRAAGRFEFEWNDMLNRAYKMTEAGAGNYEQIIALSAATGGFVLMGNPLMEAIVRDRKASQNLGNLTVKVAPVGTAQHADACQRLENTWLEWAAALDHLAAQDFFCKTIRNLVDGTVERKIVDHCYGDIGLDGRVNRKSLISRNQTALVQKSFKNKAQIVSKKMKELSCEMPDALSVMN
ncbi:MAG: hypothetical protein ACK5UJ_04145 [Pseudobdellovibrionaceae bacterium]